MFRNQVSKGSNIRELNYLPENVRDWGMDSARIRRNPISPLDMWASSRVMANAQSLITGKKMSRREKSRLGRGIDQYEGGRLTLFSPAGRGTVQTDANF
jgi:hypothetical protein